MQGKGNEIVLTVVVNGDPTKVEANVNAPLRTIVPKALEQTGHAGQAPSEWTIKDEPGKPLDPDKKIGDFGFSAASVIFLSLDAGGGG